MVGRRPPCLNTEAPPRTCYGLKRNGREILYEIQRSKAQHLATFSCSVCGEVRRRDTHGCHAVEMFGRPRRGRLRDCYNELRRILIPRTPVNKGEESRLAQGE